MVAYATHCPVNAYVSQGWWASSVTAVPLDSGSPIVQVTTSGIIIHIYEANLGLNRWQSFLVGVSNILLL